MKRNENHRIAIRPRLSEKPGADDDYVGQKETDKTLWNRFKAGDEAAFIIIYELYFNQLVNYSFQFTQNTDLIKDCVQDLFIYIRRKRTSLSSTNNIKLYLLKACKNRILEYLRKESGFKSLDEQQSTMFIPVMSYEDKVIKIQTENFEQKRLEKAISKLSFKEREVIYYFYFTNLDYKSIATLMDYDHVKSVRSLLYKALKKLKDNFL